jgi:Tfp pilus assembly protein PilN
MLPYAAAAGMLILSLLGGIYCLARLNANKRENDTLVATVQERQLEIQRLKGEGEKVQQLLTPEQKALLTAAHKLVANKAFGWSRLFADLESVLPSSVAASRIAVENVYQDGDRIKASLDFGVIARDYAAVQAMIDNMNNSGLFQAELRGQDRQQNERVTYTEYTFHLIYTPGYGYSTAPASTDVAQNQGGAQ